MTNDEVAALLESLARDDEAGWVDYPGAGPVSLQGRAVALLARRTNDESWTDEAARFYFGCCFAGRNAWYADRRWMRSRR